MTHWQDALSRVELESLRKAPHPDWTSPMLATLTDERFSDPDWIYERKLDGERLLAFRDGERVRLLTRNRIGLRRDKRPEQVTRETSGD